MNDIYLIEINSLPYARVSSIILSDNVVCPIIGVENKEKGCIEEYITKRNFYPSKDGESSIHKPLTYSKITKISKEDYEKYLGIAKSLNDVQRKDYNLYFNLLIFFAYLYRKNAKYNEIISLEKECLNLNIISDSLVAEIKR